MEAGKLVLRLHGEKLAGLWELVRISKPDDKQDQWMFFKKRDEWAHPLTEYDVIKAFPDSVVANPLGLVEDREPKIARPIHGAEPEVDLSAAVRAPMPSKLEPQLPTVATSLPTGGDWITETKLDGYRLLARINKRIVDASVGIAKADLVRYHASVAEWMLPHLKDRPVAMVRAPLWHRR
ncbi:bifunctional non-homologous end joining protein LigD [Paraburkholderia steynii]|uniref:Bifunctional non-homologous end joining protein LigD n=2 Tax=Paraburkholderia steynii TaxID=1245441 RepID=A0A7Z7FIZ0_9BURK|nr:bifunctional non-homologous end joining protein LigD [Paraburkholderia steynii]